MNILLIDHYAGSPVHGMEYRPFYLAREWVRSGHDVTILAASFSHLRTVQSQAPKGVRVEVIEGIRYVWFGTPRYSGNGVGRAINILSFVAALLFSAPYIALRYRPHVVIASSTYPLDIFPAFCLARLAGASLTFEIHDHWPLTPIELGTLSPLHPFVVLMRIAERFAYQTADSVVSVLPGTGSYMESRGFKIGNFVHIPNGIVPEEWQAANGSVPPGHATVLARLRAQGQFIVMYAGHHGLANALDGVLDAAELLQDVPVSFVMVGQGPKKVDLEARGRSKGLSNIVFLPPVPKMSIPRLLESADALCILWRISPIYRFGISPNKLWDYMMASKPIIHATSSDRDAVSESRSGITIPAENPSAFAAAVRRLAGLTEAERRRMGENGRRYVIENHDYRILARRFPLIPRAGMREIPPLRSAAD
jgi:glycosyltransferase involved in cell wall biosynthesis